MIGVFLLRDPSRVLSRGECRGVSQHVGKRSLLAADEQQREKQDEKWMQEAAHEARITTHCANQSSCSSRPLR